MRRFNTIIESANPPGINQLWIDKKKLRYFTEGKWHLLGDGGSNPPEISDHDTWIINGEDTGKPSRGEKGNKGDNGLTPFINTDKNWWIGTTNTGVKAEGKDGTDGDDGLTPQLRVTETAVEYSYDGVTWTELIPKSDFVVNNEYINNPDEEDITVVDTKLKFKDKSYSPTDFSGLGRVYLRKNLVEGKNVLTQGMVNLPNTIYHIQYDYDLNGQTITVPANCVLEFDGGSIINGSLVFDNTVLSGTSIIIRDCSLSGTLANDTVEVKWFHYENSDISQTLQYLIDTNRVVIINTGTWILYNTVLLKGNTNIIGESAGLSIIKANPDSVVNGANKYNLLSTVNMINPISITYFRNGEAGTYPFTNIVIKDIVFDTNRASIVTNPNLMCAIRLENCDNCLIDNCHFIDYNTVDNSTYDTQVYIVESKNCSLTNCKSLNCSLVKVLNCSNINISGNVGTNTVGTWIEALAGESLFIENNAITGDIRRQVFNSTIGCNSRSCHIANNRLYDAFFINLGHVSTDGDERYYGLPSDANGTIVENNTVTTTDYMAFYAQNANNIIVVNNVFKTHLTADHRPNEEWGTFVFRSATSFEDINIINNNITITSEMHDNVLYTSDGMTFSNIHRANIIGNRVLSTKRPLVIRNTSNADDDYMRIKSNKLNGYIKDNTTGAIVAKNVFFDNNTTNQEFLINATGIISICSNVFDIDQYLQVSLNNILKVIVKNNIFIGNPAVRCIYFSATAREDIIPVESFVISDNYYVSTIPFFTITDSTSNKVCKLLNLFNTQPTNFNKSKSINANVLETTTLTNNDKGFSSFTTVPVYWNGIDWVNSDGYKSSYRRSGVTSNRPVLTSSDVGLRYFDTTLNKPYWWTGTAWVTYPDSSGSTMAALTFTGAVEAAYNGSTPVTVNIPTGGGGTTNYEDLSNKPKIGDVELSSTKTLVQLGIQPAGDYATETYVTEQIAAVVGNINSVLDTINGEII
jgi:hypothetical protein